MTFAVWLVGIGLFAVAAVYFIVFLQLWGAEPVTEPSAAALASPDGWNVGAPSIYGWLDVEFTSESRIVLLALVSGGIGALIHVATSFAVFVGNRTFRGRWIWWYVLRLPIGMALALVFYFVLRAGLVAVPNGDADVAGLNPAGVVAISTLVGMFSKQATDKLKEVAGTLFNTNADAGRADKPGNPAPLVRRLEPTAVSAGTEAQTIAVHGRDFATTARILVSGQARTTEFVSDRLLKFTLLPEDTGKLVVLEIVVENPEPGGGRSDPLELVVQ